MALGYDGSIANDAKEAIKNALNSSAQTNAGSNAKNSNGKSFDGRLNGGYSVNQAKAAAAGNNIPNISALGAGDPVGKGMQDFNDDILVPIIDSIKDITKSGSDISVKPSSGYGYGSGSGAGSGVASEDPYERVMQLIRDTTAQNNAWNAEQAQIDRDWQKMMSDSAHQREVKDLQAAGLNPVLSAGGNGASTPSGAQATADTSNTRLLAEVAMSSIDAMAATALGFSRAGNKADNDNSKLGLLGKFGNAYKSNPLVKKGVDTVLNTASSVARLGIVKALF